jgi:hypothetical protein
LTTDDAVADVARVVGALGADAVVDGASPIVGRGARVPTVTDVPGLDVPTTLPACVGRPPSAADTLGAGIVDPRCASLESMAGAVDSALSVEEGEEVAVGALVLDPRLGASAGDVEGAVAPVDVNVHAPTPTARTARGATMKRLGDRRADVAEGGGWAAMETTETAETPEAFVRFAFVAP